MIDMSRKRKETDVSLIIIVAMGLWIVGAFIAEHIIYVLYGSCPTEIYIATIPPILTEAICLTKLTLDKRKYQKQEPENG